jgi:hypothetical protein
VSRTFGEMFEIPSLEALCQHVLADEATRFGSKKINELCKRVPNHLLEPILLSLLDRNQITDVALSMFLGMDTCKYMVTYIDLFIDI